MSLKGVSKKQILIISLGTTMFLTGAYWTTMWSYHFSSSTEFCVSCHEMVTSYQQYKESSHFKNSSGVVAECADCHLPPGTFNKWRAKITQGVTDSYKHLLLKPEEIDHEEWKEKAVKNISPEACRKCHKELLPLGLPKGGFLAHRAFLRGEAQTCLQCHNNLVHSDHG